jgi:hypothetical protein
VKVLRVALEIRAHKGTEGQYLNAFAPRFVQRRSDKGTAQAGTLVPWVDLRVQERDHTGSPPVLGKADKRPVHLDLEPAALGRVVHSGQTRGHPTTLNTSLVVTFD